MGQVKFVPSLLSFSSSQGLLLPALLVACPTNLSTYKHVNIYDPTLKTIIVNVITTDIILKSHSEWWNSSPSVTIYLYI